MHGWCPKVPFLYFILGSDISLSNSVCAASLLSSAVPALAQVLMVSVHLVSHHLSHFSSCLKSMVEEVKPVASFPFSLKGEVVAVAMDNHLVTGGASETVGKSPEDHCFPECPSLEHLTHPRTPELRDHKSCSGPFASGFSYLQSKTSSQTHWLLHNQWCITQGRIFYLLMVATGRRNLKCLS